MVGKILSPSKVKIARTECVDMGIAIRSKMKCSQRAGTSVVLIPSVVRPHTRFMPLRFYIQPDLLRLLTK